MAALAPAGGFNTDASTELALNDNAGNAAKVMARIRGSINGILLESAAFLDFCRSYKSPWELALVTICVAKHALETVNVKPTS
jgi:hypothetical protein